MQALLFVRIFEETILMFAHSNTYTNKLTDMRTNNTRDNMTWMQKMQMSYSGVSQSIDTWLQRNNMVSTQFLEFLFRVSENLRRSSLRKL